MKSVLTRIDNYIGWASNAGGAIGCSLIVATAALITFSSLFRYVFNHPFMFVDEYARYMLVAISYLGLGFTLRAGKHVSADVVVSRFNKQTQTGLRVITSSFGSIVLVLMLWNSWKSFVSIYKGHIVSLTPLETPLWIPYLFVAVGLTIFLLDMVAEICRGIGDFIAHRERSR